MALVCTLLPVLYTLLCARWTSACTKLRRRPDETWSAKGSLSVMAAALPAQEEAAT